MRTLALLFAKKTREESQRLLPADAKKSGNDRVILQTFGFLLSGIVTFIGFILAITMGSELREVYAKPNPQKPGRFNGETWCQYHKPDTNLDICLSQLYGDYETKVIVTSMVALVGILICIATLIVASCKAEKASSTKLIIQNSEVEDGEITLPSEKSELLNSTLT